MKSVDVTAGTIEYREEGDPSGPPVVLLHGLLMNDAQWNLALSLLPSGFRYLLPVLPMGGHRIPMRERDLKGHLRNLSSPEPTARSVAVRPVGPAGADLQLQAAIDHLRLLRAGLSSRRPSASVGRP